MGGGGGERGAVNQLGSAHSPTNHMVRGWKAAQRRVVWGRAGDVSMVAVAIATPLPPGLGSSVGECVKVEGGGVTPTLVTGLGLCAAIGLGLLQRPGLAEGTLAGGERDVRMPSIHHGNKGMGGGGGCTDGVSAANHSPRSCDHQNTQPALISCSLALA